AVNAHHRLPYKSPPRLIKSPPRLIFPQRGARAADDLSLCCSQARPLRTPGYRFDDHCLVSFITKRGYDIILQTRAFIERRGRQVMLRPHDYFHGLRLSHDASWMEAECPEHQPPTGRRGFRK